MQADLDEEKYGARGYENRIEITDAIEAKVSRYEGILGSKLDGIRSKLDDLRASLTVAIVKAQVNNADEEGGPSLANL